MKDEECVTRPRFEFGGPCPKIKQMFFPFDEEEGLRDVEEGDEDDSAQPT